MSAAVSPRFDPSTINMREIAPRPVIEMNSFQKGPGTRQPPISVCETGTVTAP